MSGPVIELDGLKRTFRQGRRTLEVLKDISLTVSAGEVVGLLGQSGAGKSTLLHIAGLLEKGDGGRVIIDGVDCSRLGEGERTRLRRTRLGFVYQFHHLLPEFSALENVELPQRIARRPTAQARDRAVEILGRLGLGERLTHRPAELSGGEQQRVAIARALANDPVLLLADEPTGNLDEATADRVIGELLAVVRDRGLAALIATHNMALAARMDRCVHLREGRLLPA